ncbi:MAG: TIGR00153 family protein [Legionellales bacterium]|nr:TIGR00153 family protein [Legionellales bacterium]
MLTSNPILNLFGRSPIKPLQQHIAKTTECVRHLMAFVSAVLNQDWQTATTCQKQVIDCEHQADALKKDIRSHLPKSLFLPVSRGDLLAILTTQDMIANKCKDIAGLIMGRHMSIPNAMAAPYIELLTSSLRVAELAHTAVGELDKLLETGFRGEEVILVEDMIDNLNQKEHENDDIQVIVRNALFAIEQQLSPIDVIFLYKMIEWTGDIANYAHRVGNLLQLLMAR